MRTTVTLDDDVVAALHTAMRERGISFKEALNAAVRSGLCAASPPSRPFRQRTHDLGISPDFDIPKTNRILADWEDEERIRKYGLGR